MTRVAWALAALIVLALVGGLVGLACDTALEFPQVAPDGGLCSQAEPNFPWLRDNVFQRSCANFSSCHDAVRPKAKLDLTPAKSYRELVGVASSEYPDKLLVNPGHPESSYLLDKLGVNQGPVWQEDGGKHMPPDGLLCIEMRTAVQQWVAQGAPESLEPDAGPDASPDAAAPDGAEADAAELDAESPLDGGEAD